MAKKKNSWCYCSLVYQKDTHRLIDFFAIYVLTTDVVHKCVLKRAWIYGSDFQRKCPKKVLTGSFVIKLYLTISIFISLLFMRWHFIRALSRWYISQQLSCSLEINIFFSCSNRKIIAFHSLTGGGFRPSCLTIYIYFTEYTIFLQDVDC